MLEGDSCYTPTIQTATDKNAAAHEKYKARSIAKHVHHRQEKEHLGHGDHPAHEETNGHTVMELSHDHGTSDAQGR